jgi:hypothetical protein
MPVSRGSHKKAPSQSPVKFFECQQQGGVHGVPTKVGDKLQSGAMREQIYGRKSLGK